MVETVRGSNTRHMGKALSNRTVKNMEVACSCCCLTPFRSLADCGGSVISGRGCCSNDLTPQHDHSAPLKRIHRSRLDSTVSCGSSIRKEQRLSVSFPHCESRCMLTVFKQVRHAPMGSEYGFEEHLLFFLFLL